ncbi:MAG: glucokinase [Myxococcota bacterium]
MAPQQATVLAGDIGGTKTHLALYRSISNRSELLRDHVFPSRDFQALEDVIASFLGAGQTVDAAAFGIAGPVVDGRVTTTNLPWIVSPEGVGAACGTSRVALLNDLESTALGALDLPADRFRVLQPGVRRPGHIAVIAAGTGLGQAFLFWDGQRFRPAATEGGHADFAPTTPEDERLLAFVRRQFGHVSWERLVSGPGLNVIFRCLVEELGHPVAPSVLARLPGADPGTVIGQAALTGECVTCTAAVDWFVRLYGTQAGNLALTVMSFGGVWLGGGIVAKLLPRFVHGPFLQAFAAKGRYQGLLRQIPVHAILEPQTSLFGARRAALELLRSA